jgi:hypothetical protein
MATRQELARRLRARYDEQCERFPVTREIGWALYKRRNLRVVVKLDDYMRINFGKEALEQYR